VALLEKETLLAEMTLNIKKTHSERLMPLVDRILAESGLEREALGAVAASGGPGSFTGLRIGVSTARALAQGLGIPAVPVCTLSAMAEAVPAPGVLICPLFDARRSQVYTALFQRSFHPPHHLETVLEPKALALDELIEVIKSDPCLEGRHQGAAACPGGEAIKRNEDASLLPVIFTGEGLHSYGDELKKALPGRAVITSAPYRLCRAALVALRGRELLKENPNASYLEVQPQYLRRPEAERKAVQKQGGPKP